MEHTITVHLPERVYEAVLRGARKAGQTPEELVSALVTKDFQPPAEDALLRLAGTLSSDVTDIGSRHDDYLGKAQHLQSQGTCGG